jgi:predicted dehydrogenase
MRKLGVEVTDFVRAMLRGDIPRVTGEDTLHALEIAVAAERSHLQGRPCSVAEAKAAH